MRDLKWWQSAVFYQIYPRSFADGNDDGIGDFPGMTSKLDYLYDLGIDAIWLSPHFPSPQADCGYDISDYTGVAAEYGTLEDFKIFLHQAHTRGIRVILDLVLNHTSDQHPWFVESRSSRDNPKRDWYVWRDGKDGGPPNNWASIFGGSAWELDPATGQYYYRVFLREQPDLNWRNPEVKHAMWDTVRFWLDLGVDGFRLDAIATVYEHPDLPNHDFPLAPADILNVNALAMEDYRQLMQYQIQQPGVHELMQELRTILDEYPGDRVLVGEDEDVAYHGPSDNELHLVFNFPLMRIDRLTPGHVRSNQTLRLAQLPADAWPCNTLGNHDSQRVWTRYGDGIHDADLARLHLASILTLKGTPFLYNGEEIGMAELRLTELSQFRDTTALRHYRMMIDQMGATTQKALETVSQTTRDGCRTPLQWSDAANAGFSTEGVATWLPVHPNHAQGVNVAEQQADPASLLHFYRRLLAVRRATPALVAGDYTALSEGSENVLLFTRSTAEQRILVALNFSEHAQTLRLPSAMFPTQVVFSEWSSAAKGGRLRLHPFEVYIAELA